MDDKLNQMDIINDFKQFASDASAYFHDEITRMKNDREFAGGQQFNDNDTANRGDGRAEVPYNFVSNYINAIVNPFKKSPYSINVTAKIDEVKPMARALQKKIKDIESVSNSKFAIHNALKNAVTTGYGYAYVTTDIDDIDEDAAVDIKIYPVLDSTMVIPDIAAKENDGSDSEQMAIIEYLKVQRAKQLFGDDVVGDLRRRSPFVGDFGETWRSPEGSLALVTYFKRKRTAIPGRNGKKVTVEFYKMIGDSVVASGEIDCPYIPIVAFKGEDLFRKGQQITVGIVDKAKYPQKTINYAQSQLRERLAKTPKNIFLADKDAIEGNEEYYENMDKSFNPILKYNSTGDGGKIITPPQRIDNSVVTGDLSSIIDSNVNYMSLIIGMPATGLTGTVGQNETAESVLMRSRSSESNQSHYYENAKSSVKHIGRILMYFIKQMEPELQTLTFKDLDITVNDGPELITTKIEQRKDLLALQQTLPDNMKPLVGYRIAKSLDVDDSEVLSKEIYAMLPPELKPNLAEDPQAKAIMDEMSTQIDTINQQSQMKDNVIAQLQNTVLALQEDSQAKILIAQMDNQTKLQLEAMKQDGQNKRLGAELVTDADKTTAEMEAKLAETRMKRAELATKYTPTYSASLGIPKV